MTITKEELDKILEEHSLWLRDKGGKRANLCGVDLCGADLRGVYLQGANLQEANLYGVDFQGASLQEANLFKANLCRVNLCEANLCEADLHEANLYKANLWRADLRRANFSEADLCKANLVGANLWGANLYGANLSSTDFYRAHLSGTDPYKAINIPFIPMACPDTGSFIAWKKVSEYIIKLQIPEDARRSSTTGRKCRANKALVLAIENLDGTSVEFKEIGSNYDPDFIYKVGETVSVNDFCENRFDECAPGIHFFINREEAVQYSFP